MWPEDHFGSGSQRNERVKLAASFWNNVGAGMVIGGLAAAFFLEKPSGTWTKIAIAIAGLVLGWLCYPIDSNIQTNACSRRIQAFIVMAPPCSGAARGRDRESGGRGRRLRARRGSPR